MKHHYLKEHVWNHAYFVPELMGHTIILLMNSIPNNICLSTISVHRVVGGSIISVYLGHTSGIKQDLPTGS